jgi:hypothetical protein
MKLKAIYDPKVHLGVKFFIKLIILCMHLQTNSIAYVRDKPTLIISISLYY